MKQFPRRVPVSPELAAFQDRVISVVMGDRHRPWFRITPVVDACKVLGINDYFNDPNYNLLSGLHCRDYSEMSEDMRKMIPQAIRDVLTPKEKPSRSGFLSRIFRRKEKA